MPLANAPQAMYNYIYFYKTTVGNYEIKLGSPPSDHELYDRDNGPDPSIVGARVTIRNHTGVSGVSVVGMDVFNKGTSTDFISFGSYMWNPPGPIPNGASAVIDVVSTPKMPIFSGQEYGVHIHLRNSNGTTWVVDDPVNLRFIEPPPASPPRDDELYGGLPANRRTVTLTGVHAIPTPISSTPSPGNPMPFYFMYQALYDGIILVPVGVMHTRIPATASSAGVRNPKTGSTNRSWATTDSDFNFDNFNGIFPANALTGVIHSCRIRPTNSSGSLHSMSRDYIYEGDPVREILTSDQYYVFFKVWEEVGGRVVQRVYGNGNRTPSENTLFLLDVGPETAEGSPRFVLWNHSDRSNMLRDMDHTMRTARIHVRSHSGNFGTTPTEVITATHTTSLHNGGTFRNRGPVPITVFRFRYDNRSIQHWPIQDNRGNITFLF
jgi:hypothetical protein